MPSSGWRKLRRETKHGKGEASRDTSVVPGFVGQGRIQLGTEHSGKAICPRRRKQVDVLLETQAGSGHSLNGRPVNVNGSLLRTTLARWAAHPGSPDLDLRTEAGGWAPRRTAGRTGQVVAAVEPGRSLLARSGFGGGGQTVGTHFTGWAAALRRSFALRLRRTLRADRVAAGRGNGGGSRGGSGEQV
jgi:hypothetical protein